MLRLVKFLWSWFTNKKPEQPIQQKEVVPEQPEQPAPKKGSLQDIAKFCDEIRRDLWIKKKTDDRLYDEMDNLKKKIERFIESPK